MWIHHCPQLVNFWIFTFQPLPPAGLVPSNCGGSGFCVKFSISSMKSKGPSCHFLSMEKRLKNVRAKLNFLFPPRLCTPHYPRAYAWNLDVLLLDVCEHVRLLDNSAFQVCLTRTGQGRAKGLGAMQMRTEHWLRRVKKMFESVKFSHALTFSIHI